MRVPSTKVVSHASSPTSAPLPHASTASPVNVSRSPPLSVPSDNNRTPPDTPTPKFGEALRQQVEERLTFFETGAAPGKNADAIRKVLDQLALENEDEDEDAEMVVDADAADAEPALPLIEAEPPRKKDKKKKKRKLDEMDVDEEDGEPVKKVKLSKEEKKALKKEKRKRMEEEAAAEVSRASYHLSPPNLRVAGRISKGEKGEKEGREGKGKEGKEEQTLMTTTHLPDLPQPCFSSVSLIISSCLCISVNYAQCT